MDHRLHTPLLTLAILCASFFFGCTTARHGNGGPTDPPDGESLRPNVIQVTNVWESEADSGTPKGDYDSSVGEPWAVGDASLPEPGPTEDAGSFLPPAEDSGPEEYCEAQVSGAWLPWNCDDVCGSGADAVPCADPVIPVAYRPVPPAAQSLEQRQDFAAYEGNCRDLDVCWQGDPSYPGNGGTPETCADQTGAVDRCDQVCVRLYACCENMDDGRSCGVVLDLDTVTYSAWCSRELSGLECG